VIEAVQLGFSFNVMTFILAMSGIVHNLGSMESEVGIVDNKHAVWDCNDFGCFGLIILLRQISDLRLLSNDHLFANLVFSCGGSCKPTQWPTKSES
jgi:hypothetical protein